MRKSVLRFGSLKNTIYGPLDAHRRLGRVGYRFVSSQRNGKFQTFQPRNNGMMMVGATVFSGLLVASFVHSSVGDRQVGQPNVVECQGGRPFNPNFIADAAEVAIPALVNISSIQNGPWGSMVASAGSGFVIRSDGLIATNAHVVSRAKTLTVTTYDGRQYQAKVHSVDPMSDLALVIIDDTLESPLPTMKIGDSSLLRPGEFVIALGSPLNMQNSVTAGIVSSTARDGSEIGVPQARTEYLQVDAAINQGNSGGPLINLEGEVVGINTMKVAGGDGIGFAIPINTAWSVLCQLRDTGRVVRPYLGLRMAALQKNLIAYERRHNSKFPDIEQGLLVVKVAPGSPAARAGIESGDIIIKFDDKKVKKVSDITNTIGYNLGRTYEVTLVRPGSPSKVVYVTTEGLDF